MSTNEHHMDWPPSDPKVVKEELIQTTKRGSSILKKVSWVMEKENICENYLESI